jgi:hypothetical protein
MAFSSSSPQARPQGGRWADDHKGLRATAARVFNATRQRCRVHWQRNLLAHAKPKQRPAVAAISRGPHEACFVGWG